MSSKIDWKNLKERLKQAMDSVHRPIAAFDADGTLWRNDLGEALFDFQVKKNLLRGLPEDPWRHYEGLKKQVSHEVAYLWLAQINLGLPIDQVRAWAEEAVAAMSPVPIFPEIQDLIQFLQQAKVEVYIVTASIQWAVEPGARRLGLPAENVIGIRTRVVNGIVTDEQEGPITYKSGKVSGLLERTRGSAPFFCAGNTEGDLPLLEAATHHRLVIASAPAGDRNHSTETRMQEVALQRGWWSVQL